MNEALKTQKQKLMCQRKIKEEEKECTLSF
jgi:hypothetical protein